LAKAVLATRDVLIIVRQLIVNCHLSN